MSTPVDRFVSRVEKVKATRPGHWRARCPSHGSKGLTLSIAEGDDGTVLLHCFAGCDVAAIVGAVGLELSDLFPRDAVIASRRYDRTPGKVYKGKLFALSHAATVVQIGAESVRQGEPLSETNLEALDSACAAIRRALE